MSVSGTWPAATADIQANMLHPLTGTESNLVAYWKFDEGSGTAAFDATGHGFNGILVNGPSWVTSTVPQASAGWGTALSCAGVDDYVSTTVPALASNYTVSAWVFLRGGGNDQGGKNVVGVLSATNCGGSTEVTIHSTTASYTDPQHLELGRCGQFPGTLSSGTVPLNQWVHLAVTVSSDRQVNYFINGDPAGSWDASWDVTIGPNITLGDNTQRQFNGMLDEVQIWNVARSQADIQANMVQPLTGYEPGLVAYYRFDEGGGITVYDASPNHNNGTLLNRPVRVPSTITPLPIITLFGANPMTNQFNVPFVDPGATAGAGPVSLAAGGVGESFDLALGADGSVVGWEIIIGPFLPVRPTGWWRLRPGGWDSAWGLRLTAQSSAGEI